MQVATIPSPIVKSAAGESAGFYPGRASGVTNNYERADFDLYATRAQPMATEVEKRISAISNGQLEPGCIGKDVYTCMATMSRTLVITTRYDYGALDIQMNQDSKDPLIAHDRKDVNGKTIFTHSLKFQAFVPGLDIGAPLPSLNALTVNVILRDNRTIRSMSIILRRDPLSATTQAEYDQTGIYEILSAVSMPVCHNLQRLDVYKIIENSVKPKLKPVHDFKASMSDISETHGKEGAVKFCGRNLFFYSFSGNAVSAVSQLNDTGIIGGATLTVE